MRFAMSSLLALTLSLPALAAKTVPSIISVSHEGKNCLGYPLPTPATEPDAVVVPLSCVGSAALGNVKIDLKDGQASSMEVLRGEGDSQLAVVLFQNGTLLGDLKAVKLGEKQALAGAPLFSEDGGLVGITDRCANNECDVINVEHEANLKFLAGVKENLWGKDVVPVVGNEHQNCRLLRGFFGGHHHHHRHVGFYHPRPAFHYHSHVSITIVQVQVVTYVHRPVYHVHYHNPAPACHTPQCQPTPKVCPGETPPAGYEPSQPVVYTPPPPPAYLGIYDPAAQPIAVKQEVKLGANTVVLREKRAATEAQLASSVPNESLQSANQELYAQGLQKPGVDNAAYIARRENPAPANSVLVAQDRK